MTERTLGAKYDRSLDTAQIAKRVREDIKTAIASGDLPKMKTTVRIQRFSGGSSISVGVAEVECLRLFNPGRLTADRDRPHDYSPLPVYSAEASALLKKIHAILGAYNHDGSDIMTDYCDVKFFEHVDFAHDWERVQREKELGELASEELTDAAHTHAASRPEPRSNVVSILSAGVLPYRVRASCGHIVIRKMRESTAGVPFTEDVLLESPTGRPCEPCEKAHTEAVDAMWAARANCPANWAHDSGKGCDLCIP